MTSVGFVGEALLDLWRFGIGAGEGGRSSLSLASEFWLLCERLLTAVELDADDELLLELGVRLRDVRFLSCFGLDMSSRLRFRF